MPRDLNIVVVTGTDSGYAREVLLGFHAGAVQRGWMVDVLQAHRAVDILLADYNPDAIVVGAIGYFKIPGPIRRSKVFVGAGLEHPAASVSRVLIDDVAVGRMAAEHFADIGLRAVATLGFGLPGFAERRYKAFAERAEERGLRYWGYFNQIEPTRKLPRPHVWEPMRDWLRGAPKPLGLFCGCDLWGREATLGCRITGVRVPEEVAVLGVDNDEVECELTWPALSSVSLPWDKMGQIAADLLERRLKGGRPLKKPVMLPPTEVVVRRSSDVLAVEDPDVSEALTFIRDQATRGPVRVADILKRVPTHRARLHRAFREHLGRTIMQEVRRVRVEHAKRLLTATSLTVDQVALRSGFANYRKLSIAFRAAAEMTPGEYRKRFRV